MEVNRTLLTDYSIQPRAICEEGERERRIDRTNGIHTSIR